MISLTNGLRLALLILATAACVLYFYTPIFADNSNWYDAWGGFDDAVGRECLLVLFIPGYVISGFLHFSELLWKRLLGLTAVGLLQVAWLWNLVAAWIGGQTLIAHKPWMEGHHGWDWLCLSSALVCLAGVGYVGWRDWQASRWKQTGFGYKPLPGAENRKAKGRYNAYARTVDDAQPPERVRLD